MRKTTKVMGTITTLGMGAVIAGCSSPVSSEAVLAMAVVVDEVFYAASADLNPQTETVGEKYTEVSRYVDCREGVWINTNTYVSDHCPLQNGESNYLPTGTPIHRIAGVDPVTALTVFYGDVWQVLRSGGAR